MNTVAYIVLALAAYTTGSWVLLLFRQVGFEKRTRKAVELLAEAILRIIAAGK